MWQIEENRRIDKQLSDYVPIEVLKRYEKWKDIARLSGPQGLRPLRDITSRGLGGRVLPHPAGTPGTEQKPAARDYGYYASHHLRQREWPGEFGRRACKGSCPCAQLPSRRARIFGWEVPLGRAA